MKRLRIQKEEKDGSDLPIIKYKTKSKKPKIRKRRVSYSHTPRTRNSPLKKKRKKKFDRLIREKRRRVHSFSGKERPKKYKKKKRGISKGSFRFPKLTTPTGNGGSFFMKKKTNLDFLFNEAKYGPLSLITSFLPFNELLLTTQLVNKAFSISCQFDVLLSNRALSTEELSRFYKLKINPDFLVFLFQTYPRNFNRYFDNQYPLRFCCEKGWTNCVVLLLNDPLVDMTVFNNQCLFLCCKFREYDILRLLLEREELEFYEGWFYKCLDVYEMKGEDFDIEEFQKIRELFEKFLLKWETKHGTKCLKNSTKILKNVTSKKFGEWISILDRYDVDLNYNLRKIDIYGIGTRCCEFGDLKTLKFMLNEIEIDPSIEGNFMLHLAVTKSHLSLVEELLKHKFVDPTDKANILYAGSFKITEALMKDPRNDSDQEKWKIIIEDSVREGKIQPVAKILSDERWNWNPDFYVELIKSAFKFAYPNKYQMVCLLMNHPRANLDGVDFLLIDMYENSFMKKIVKPEKWYFEKFYPKHIALKEEKTKGLFLDRDKMKKKKGFKKKFLDLQI